MKFRVPQFIEVEDKLFGPLTFRQFLYLVGAGALAFVIWSLIPVAFFAVLLAGPVLAFGIALAFVRINNRPFMNTLEAGFIYLTKSKLYIWKKVPNKKPAVKEAEDIEPEVTPSFVPRLSESKLKELSWGLDVYDNSNRN
jgi:hypothetical protein